MASHEEIESREKRESVENDEQAFGKTCVRTAEGKLKNLITKCCIRMHFRRLFPRLGLVRLVCL